MNTYTDDSFSLTKTKLVSRLADGHWHSGEALGDALGVSRAAIAKQVKQLEQYGLVCNVQKGRGYKLDSALELLAEDTVMASLSVLSEGGMPTLCLLQSVDSTNQCLMQRAKNNGDVHGHVVVAEHQRSGKGRLGRVWQSPFGKNIYMSMAWCFNDGIAVLEGLSLAIGVVICRVLNAVALGGSVAGLGLKWPNDILVERKKLGGVLIEIAGDPVGDCTAVIGIGLNVDMDASDRIDQPWTSLRQLGYSGLRNAVLAKLIREVTMMLSRYHLDRFESYVDEWNALNAFSDQDIDIISGVHRHSGVMCGVDHCGAVLLRVNGERKRFFGGELSLRASM